MTDSFVRRDYARNYCFIRESNGIEGLHHLPTNAEVNEFTRFMALAEITIDDLTQFVSVYEPTAKLRTEQGMFANVGKHCAPAGGVAIGLSLEKILLDAIDWSKSYEIRHRYETLHPFTDCNGRSGRALWAWMYRDLSRGFLHEWYYQSLRYGRD